MDSHLKIQAEKGQVASTVSEHWDFVQDWVEKGFVGQTGLIVIVVMVACTVVIVLDAHAGVERRENLLSSLNGTMHLTGQESEQV